MLNANAVVRPDVGSKATPSPRDLLEEEFGVPLDQLVLTPSRVPVRFDDPSQQIVLEADLFAGLHGKRRWNGYARGDVLVHLAHCTKMARVDNANPFAVAYIAAHDLHEAYIGDFPRPGKSALAGYEEMEKAFHDRVHEHFGLYLSKGYGRSTKRYDIRGLLAEAHVYSMNADVVETQIGQKARRKDIDSLERLLNGLEQGSYAPKDLFTYVMSAVHRRTHLGVACI